MLPLDSIQLLSFSALAGCSCSKLSKNYEHFQRCLHKKQRSAIFYTSYRKNDREGDVFSEFNFHLNKSQIEAIKLGNAIRQKDSYGLALIMALIIITKFDLYLSLYMLTNNLSSSSLKTPTVCD